METGRILIFKIKSACYASTFQLADLLGAQLERLGYAVEYFSTDEQELTSLEQYFGRRFDAMIDFNSILPNLDTDEDEYVLDLIDAPFYDYILDHPLYHNKQLKAPLKNFQVICLDEGHGAYLREYYPHLKGITVLPLPGLPGAEPADCRDMDILFTGTYTPADALYEKIGQFDKPFSDEMKLLIDVMTEDMSLETEQAVLELADRLHFDKTKIDMRERLYSFFLVDMYMKAYVRDKVLKEVLKSGRELTVYGGQWELYDVPAGAKIVIRDMVPFSDTPGLMARAKIALNVMPWFKAGIHDRILTAMRSGALVFTDGSRMLDREFRDGEELVRYSLDKTEEIPELLCGILDNPDRREAIAERGRQAAEERHSESAWAEKIIKVFDEKKH